MFYIDNGGMKMDKTTEVIDTLVDKIEKFNEVVETVSENDYAKFLTNTSKIVSSAVKLNNFIISKRFEAFLKGLANGEPTDRQLQKLERYIDSPEKAEFIADSFRKVLLSNSSRSSLIMGIILYTIIENEEDITHEKLICLNALSEFYDIDIQNFILLYEFKDYKRLNVTNLAYNLGIGPKSYIKFDLSYLREFASINNVSKESLIITLDKSINLQLINRNYKANMSVDIDAEYELADVTNSEIEEYYAFNVIGEHFKSLIDKAKIITT